MNTIPEKAVITLATGKDIYINMAVNLARSFKRWHSDSSIEFFLATDQVNLIPEDIELLPWNKEGITVNVAQQMKWMSEVQTSSSLVHLLNV